MAGTCRFRRLAVVPGRDGRADTQACFRILSRGLAGTAACLMLSVEPLSTGSMVDHEREIARVRILSNVVLFTVTLLLCALSLEIGFRAVSGVPMLVSTDWRNAYLSRSGAAEIARYDPMLGWTMKDGFIGGQVNLLEYGVRKNRASDSRVRTGGILAVGDSFTAGSQVNDDETWPAQLESLIDRPVINAGVGGYGVDQMVLRAEQLMPVVRPKILILGTQDQGILRVAYSAYGRPKPYFSIQDAKLVPHNSPVPTHGQSQAETSAVKRILGHSFLIDRLMGIYDPQWWYAQPGQEFTKVGIDDVDVTCALLQRLKRETDAQEIRFLVLLQYGGVISALQKPPPNAAMVAQCARAAGIQLVDEFASLHAIAARSLEEFKHYYVMSPDGASFGHMSALGNRHVAGLIEQALKQDPPGPATAVDEAVPPQQGDGPAHASFSRVLDEIPAVAGPIAMLRPVSGEPMRPREFELKAAGGDSEHYVSIPDLRLPPGPYTLSVEMRGRGTVRVRLQLLDGQSNGSIVDYNLAEHAVAISRAGFARGLRAMATASADGWSELSLTVTLPGKGGVVILQLLDGQGRQVFKPDDEAIEFRDLMIEGSSTPSAYKVGNVR